MINSKAICSKNTVEHRVAGWSQSLGCVNVGCPLVGQVNSSLFACVG